MANIFSSLFKQTKTEKPQEDMHPPTAPIEFSQYDSEFISYCIERVETLGKLESEIHAIDDPQDTVMQVLRTACAFHAADWTGILYVDVELGITSTGWWHNPDPQIKTLQVISEFENFFPMESWQKAIKIKQPVVVTDLSIIAKDSPQEYLVYKRLGVKTMIALPFGPKPLGFLVIRNPTRYNSFTGAGIGFAYICHSALVQKRMLDRAKMALTPEEIKSDKDIIINFFGDLEIITQNGIWKEQNFNSPKSTRAVVFVMLQGKRAHSPLTIADALYPEDTSDTDTINKNIRGYIYRFRKSFELISKHRLIEYTSNGYKLNSTLNIKTDIHQFETIWEQVQQDIPMTHKVHLLKRAIKLYKGAVFQTASDDHWLVGIATEFKMKYISMVNELLSIRDKNQRRVPMSEWIIHPDAHEAIIPREKWEQANEMLRSPKKVSKAVLDQPDRVYYCAHCGRKLRKTYGSDQYYSCASAKYQHDSECSGIRLKRSEMEEILIETLRAQINLVKQSGQAVKKEKVSPSVECYRAITQVDKELVQLRNRKLERYEAYRSGEISREDFIKVKDQITMQTDELTAKKEQLEKDYQALLHAKEHEAETKSEVSQAEKVLADFDAGLREHLYEAIEQVIVTSNEQIEIKWVFADVFNQKEEIC